MPKASPMAFVSVRRRALCIFALALLLLIGGAVAAFAAVSVIPARGPAFRVAVNKGSLLRLDRPAATVFVADPEVCDIQVKSPTLVYLMGKKPGDTTLYAVDQDENVIASVDIQVTHDLGRLQQVVRSLHPGIRLGLASVGGSVVVKGAVPSAAVAEDVRRLAANYVDQNGEVINRLAVVAPSQVSLRVRVAEVSRRIDKQLGFNWEVFGSIGSFQFSMLTANPFGQNLVADVLGLGAQSGSWDANVLIDALEDEGLVSILAEPNLTALSGETASFLAGGEFPILVPQGDNQITIEFKKFGVSLAFTPTLLSDGRISLKVRPEVSELSQDGAISIPVAGGTLSVPALTVRRAETTVELGSGQSFAIAGLLRNTVSHGLHKFPGLADLPILGTLFRSDAFRRDETELVIIVTPYVVRPAANDRLAVPNDGFSPPHDVERLLVGGNYRRNPRAGQPSVIAPNGRRLIGPVGFIVE